MGDGSRRRHKLFSEDGCLDSISFPEDHSLSGLEYLYIKKYDTQPSKLGTVKFEVVSVIDYDEKIVSQIDFRYSILPERHMGQMVEKFITIDDVKFDTLDRIKTPELAVSNKACSLSREYTLKIIRCYLKKNIDEKYATITSDYDFHIAVEKKLKLAKPVEYQENIGKRKPKYVTRFRTERGEKVYDVGTEKKNYSPIVIDPFKGG